MSRLIKNIRKYIIAITVLLVFVLCSILLSIILNDSKNIPFTDFNYEVKKNNTNKVIVSFRNDDLSVISNPSHEKSVLNVFWKYGIQQTFAFIPIRNEIDKEALNYEENVEFINLLTQWEKEKKIEIALHGFEHKKNKYSQGEFKGLPYKLQVEKIKNGKTILDKNLKTDIKIFVPPWNQADENTIKACINSGINIFSGYLGQKEADKITFVNSNTVLFRSRKKNYSNENDIPIFEDVLDLALNGKGSVFLIAIYHSRTDFRNQSDFIYLDNLLQRLRRNPNIEIASIGEIATKYKKELKRYNQAGVNLKESKYAIHVAKPYLKIVRNVLGLFDKRTSIDRHYNDATIQYFHGRYLSVGNISKLIVEKCKSLIITCRTILSLLYAAGFMVILYLFRSGTKLFPKRYFYILSIYILIPIALPFIFLNAIQPISAVRIIELNRTFLLCISNLTAITIILYSLAFRHKK